MTLSCGLKGAQKVFFLELNQSASCCRAWPEAIPADASMQSLQQHWQTQAQQLELGQALSGCSVCWQDEKLGKTSFRQQHAGQDLDDIELFVDNACNQMCSYCSPKFSSTWQQNIQQQGMFAGVSRRAKENLAIPIRADVNIDYWVNEIFNYVQQQPPHTVKLALLGGEPLMQIRNIQKFASTMSRLRLLTINTNLNPPSNKFLHWVLDHVPAQRLLMRVSLDATPGYNHVPRGLFDQQRFLENFETIKRSGASIRIISTLSILSLFDLPNFVTWVDQQQVAQSIFRVNNPDCLAPDLVSVDVLENLKQKFTDLVPQAFADLLVNHQTPIDLKLIEQYNYISQYFTRTGIDVDQIDNDLFHAWWNNLKTITSK
jgi:organic radical activating enzyme